MPALVWSRRTSLCAMAAVLLGCQSAPTTPEPSARGFTPEQVRVLRAEGFEPADQDWALLMPSKLLFDVGSEQLLPEQAAYVQRLAQALLQVGLHNLRVEGHTDDTGSAEYNQNLSLRRAQSVARAMIEAGMPSTDLVTKGWGSTRPLVTGQQAADRRENRRVAIIVSVP